MFKRLITKKTFWGGIALIGAGIASFVNGDTQEAIRTILEGVTVITLRDAIRKIE